MPDGRPGRGATPVTGGGQDQAPVWRLLPRPQTGFAITYPTRGEDDVQLLSMISPTVPPLPEMEHAFPWRCADDPMNRVFAPYADRDGNVHPRVLAGADNITATLLPHSARLLRDIARDPTDTRLPVTAARQLDTAWKKRLETDVAREITRLTKGEPLPEPLVRIVRVEPAHVGEVEQGLVGHWGVRLDRQDEALSVRHGRILGVYAGAVLNTEEVEARWKATYPSFPHYTMNVGRDKALGYPMSAEGAANSAAFANTAVRLERDADGEPVKNADGTNVLVYDDDVINTQFLTFAVTMTDKNGHRREEVIAVLVALDNAFDPVGNPYGLVIADYSDIDYLRKISPRVKGEPGEPNLG